MGISPRAASFGSACEALFRLRTANWQATRNAAADHAPQRLDIVTYRQAQRLPINRNGTRVYGTES